LEVKKIIMSSKWNEAYAELQSFITANPSIKISASITSIPGDVRPEFYRLFDKVRIAYVEGEFPALLREAKTLSENYTKTRQAVMELLQLESITSLNFLDRFLSDPLDELYRGLLDPLFDLLKGKIDLAAFESQGSASIETTFGNLHRLGYSKWLALSLVKLLEADKLFAGVPPETKMDGHGDPLHNRMPVDTPQETKKLTFDHGPDDFSAFIMPHFIVHSAKLDRYVSIRSELRGASYTTANASEKREWYQIDAMSNEHRLALRNPSLLIYIDDELDDIALIADTNMICRPDLIVEYREQKDWSMKKDVLARRTGLYDVLNPVLGRYIVSQEPVSEEALAMLTPDPEPAPEPTDSELAEGITPGEEAQTLPDQVLQEPGDPEAQPLPDQVPQEPEKRRPETHVLTVGFDLSNLDPIMEVMINSNYQDPEQNGELTHKETI
jgi:hypothetical protein|tara:strand:+ start:516 stop:1838 length:1323 start_codon:yes stop_codon:yes gene_type:complete